MSKEAAVRAMREARYRERSAAPTPAPPTSAPAKPAARPTKKQTSSAGAPAPATDALCGHRSMNGRTCTREQGHTAKSHRYS